MPNLSSSKKRMRQSIARTKRNRLQRGALRSAMKKVRVAQTSGEASEAFALAERLLDRAALKHLIHRNKAARHKSRLLAVVQSKSS
ncbi:MAG: 30S ribosomal protein S20 [Gemmatimonadetes bacterium]|nr:30S ribosomal protein S20 [Gemmatimonadota bacterium]